MFPFTQFRFNLRLKLILGFVVFLLISSWINFLFLRDFDAFQRDVRILSHASTISNLSLEIRRYEKNFIIRNDVEDYNTATRFLEELQAYFNRLNDDIDERYTAVFADLQAETGRYREQFTGLRRLCPDKLTPQECEATERLQMMGAKIVNLGEGMMRSAEEEIDRFTKESKIKLSLYYAFLVAFSLLGMIVYHATIARRLKALEKAADAIAAGNYVSQPTSNYNDEVEVVFKAFQRMVVELEERQEQLFQAEKLSSIGTLASGMAHQLNNPLNNIATSCQLAADEAREGSDPEFLQKMLATIEEETQRSAQIVRGLLEFSRREMFACKLVSIRDMVNKAVGLVASELPAGITIQQDVPDELVACVDEQKMKEVFLNLLINAIQSIPEPPGTIVIAAEADPESDRIIISFSDTGVGISEQDRQKIFDPFYTTKDVGKGTGLGLAVVYGIINKHKGTITVRSNKGKGTTFVISLPRG